MDLVSTDLDFWMSRLNDSELVLHEHLDFGLCSDLGLRRLDGRFGFSGFFVGFSGSLDQVFLLDIGVLVSINLTYTNILLKFKVCKRTNA
ncbi:hypothetical protein GGD38_007333 [Chitinophagaceae bacterium OAS944]|nr:hypothetical protein [Chitinophagaceae bacterium OAS944]